MRRLVPLLTLAVLLMAASPFGGPAQALAGAAAAGGRVGLISFYGAHRAGRRTASGGRFHPDAFTAAAPTLRFGARMRVTVPATGRSVVVTITDRMPRRGRLLDVSLGAARALGILRRGVVLAMIRPASGPAIAARH